MPTRSKRSPANSNDDIIKLLTTAFNAELETVINYVANSVNLDGVRAEQIKASLAADVTAELAHAQILAKRIKTLGGTAPGSQKLTWNQRSLQPPKESTDVVAVIKGVIEAEQAAIDLYEELIRLCDGRDYVTQDVAITILADEQDHHREFIGFLMEYQKSARV